MATLIHRAEYARYDFGPEHPFTPARLEMLLDLLRELGVPLDLHAAPAATREDLLTVHDPEYLDLVARLDRGERVERAQAFGLDTPDNPVFPGMDEAARWLVGGALEGARRILADDARQVLQLGGGLHHAQRARAEGFCLYNDLAVAIQAFVDKGWRVAYLDIDLHHGDGVQSLFYEQDRVLTLSLHESGHYLFPGTGHIHELGGGYARGLSINLPFEPFTGPEDYLAAFDAVVPEALANFGPQVLVVQAGADAHFDDPMGDLALTTQAFESLYRRILDLAEARTQGRLLVTLGGGYEAQVVCRVWAILVLTLLGRPIPEALPEAWVDRWRDRLGPRPPSWLHDPVPPHPPIPGEDLRRRHNQDTLSRLLDSLGRFWF